MLRSTNGSPQVVSAQQGATIISPATSTGGIPKFNIQGIELVQLLKPEAPESNKANVLITQEAQVIQNPVKYNFLPALTTHSALKKAYQQDPNEPSKRPVIQEAATTIQPTQIVASGIPAAAKIIKNQMSPAETNGLMLLYGIYFKNEIVYFGVKFYSFKLS